MRRSVTDRIGIAALPNWQLRAIQWLAHAGSMLRAALQLAEATTGASGRPFQTHVRHIFGLSSDFKASY
eukprot:4684789-Pyramimonas_sp.AAC.1